MQSAERFIKLKTDQWVLDTEKLECYRMEEEPHLAFKVIPKEDGTLEIERDFGIEVPFNVMKLAKKYIEENSLYVTKKETGVK